MEKEFERIRKHLEQALESLKNAQAASEKGAWDSAEHHLFSCEMRARDAGESTSALRKESF